MTELEIIELFCEVDDFVIHLDRFSLEQPACHSRPSQRQSTGLSLSEMMTILISFHRSGYRTFKHFYIREVHLRWKRLFPRMLSYSRFVGKTPRTLVPLTMFLHTRFGEQTGIAFVDSTKIVVCKNKRIKRNKVFKGLAKVGKSTMGWFYGFKCHLIINDQGELLAVRITPGNVDDRKPIPEMAKGLWGRIFGDKGYISTKLFDQLWGQGLKMVTHIRSNMKNKLTPMMDKILLRKRSLIETVNDQIKNTSQVEHTRHRSPTNAFVNITAALIAYTFQQKKPSLNFEINLNEKRNNTAI